MFNPETFQILILGSLMTLVIMGVALFTLLLKLVELIEGPFSEKFKHLSDCITENQIDNINELLLFRSTVMEDMEKDKEKIREQTDFLKRVQEIKNNIKDNS